MVDLRRGVNDIFERREGGVEPFGNELEVAMSHVVQEIDNSNVCKDSHDVSFSDIYR